MQALKDYPIPLNNYQVEEEIKKNQELRCRLQQKYTKDGHNNTAL